MPVIMRHSLVSKNEATIQVPIQAANTQEQQIEFILGMGFSGSLTLPQSIITALGLPFRSRGSAILADGSKTDFDKDAATIIWDGEQRRVLVEAADTDPLVGMGLPYGFNINIQAIDGGSVRIGRLIA